MMFDNCLIAIGVYYLGGMLLLGMLLEWLGASPTVEFILAFPFIFLAFCVCIALIMILLEHVGIIDLPED